MVMARDGSDGPRTAKAGFGDVILVCRKCAKRQGMSGRDVARVLKRAGKAAGEADGRRKPKVVETGCLGPCPKHLLAVATSASLARGRIALLDPTLPADELAALLDFGSEPR